MKKTILTLSIISLFSCSRMNSNLMGRGENNAKTTVSLYSNCPKDKIEPLGSIRTGSVRTYKFSACGKIYIAKPNATTGWDIVKSEE